MCLKLPYVVKCLMVRLRTEVTVGNYATTNHIITIYFTVCSWFSADNGSTSTITSGPQNLPQFEVSTLCILLTLAFHENNNGKKMLFL